MITYSLIINIDDMPIEVHGVPTQENVRNTALEKLYSQCNGLDVILNDKPAHFTFNALSSTTDCKTYSKRMWITENDYNRLRLLNKDFSRVIRKHKTRSNSDIIDFYRLLLNNNSVLITLYVHDSEFLT